MRRLTLKEILDAIQMRYPYPHGYTDQQIVSILNDVQRRIFRTLYKVESLEKQDIFANLPFYPIPCSPDAIISVSVFGHEYPHQNVKYEPQERYYYHAEQGYIGIYPTPQETVTCGLAIAYYREPQPLKVEDEEDFNTIPELDSAWHDLLVERACLKLAEIARDHDMVTTFTISVNRLEDEYKRSKIARPVKIKDVYGIRRGMQ